MGSPLLARLPVSFWEKVDKTDTCWLWTGCVLQNGYGRLGQVYAHRISHELFIGPIPEGLEIDHLCRVRNCVNPEHLEAVTRAENLRRAVPFRRSRTVPTHCRQGHEYVPGGTRCLTCESASNRRKYLRRLEKAGKSPRLSREESHAAHLERVRQILRSA